MKKYKHFLLSSIGVFFVLLFVHMILLLLVDPLGITRVDFLKREFFVKEMRFQSAGIINNFDFDSAIIGTSMAENFNAKEADQMLGGYFYNLSLSGSLLKERKVVLDYLLSKKKVKTVIMSLDGSTEFQRNGEIPLESWSFLYNDTYLDDFQVYLNRKYVPYLNCQSLFNNAAVSFLFGECPVAKIRNDVDLLTEWQSDPVHNKRFGGIENWIKNKQNDQIQQSITRITQAANAVENRQNMSALPSGVKLYDYAQFEQNIMPLVRGHSDSQFILFLPPYSLIEYAIMYQAEPHLFNEYLTFVKNVVLEAEKYQNIDIYWFNDHDFTNDIANYKDLIHYHASYNSMFLKEFSQKTSIINYANYGDLIDDLQQRAKKVDLPMLARAFKD